MRWIAHDRGKVRRGKGEPPAGDIYMVDEKGSAALVGGRLYIDGRPAPPGMHRLDLGDVVLPVEVVEEDGPHGKKHRRARRLKTKPKEGRARAS